jgi:hypothetical protein
MDRLAKDCVAAIRFLQACPDERHIAIAGRAIRAFAHAEGSDKKAAEQIRGAFGGDDLHPEIEEIIARLEAKPI